MKNLRSLNIKIDKDTHSLLKLYAAAKDIQLSQAVDELVKFSLKNMEVKAQEENILITLTPHFPQVTEDEEKQISASHKDIEEGRVTQYGSTSEEILRNLKSL